jgi:group I intron endonuclease
MFLYIITNIVNKKQYVGIATNPDRRWIEHRCGHGSILVYQAIKKYGLKNFQFETMHEGIEQEIKELEILSIQTLETRAPNGYNLTAGGEGSWGWSPSEETRRKMSLARKGERNGMFGKKQSLETREKIRQKAKQRPLTKQRLATLRKNAGKGAKNPNAKPITLNGKHYGCVKDAARDLNVSSSLVCKLRRLGKTTYTPKKRKL